jgi:hypothetical protein
MIINKLFLNNEDVIALADEETSVTTYTENIRLNIEKFIRLNLLAVYVTQPHNLLI